MAPGTETVNDSEEFSVVNIVISFSRCERLGNIRARVPGPIGVGLKENTSSSVFRGIRCESERFLEIREAKNRFLQESRFKLVESRVT